MCGRSRVSLQPEEVLAASGVERKQWRDADQYRPSYKCTTPLAVTVCAFVNRQDYLVCFDVKYSLTLCVNACSVAPGFRTPVIRQCKESSPELQTMTCAASTLCSAYWHWPALCIFMRAAHSWNTVFLVPAVPLRESAVTLLLWQGGAWCQAGPRRTRPQTTTGCSMREASLWRRKARCKHCSGSRTLLHVYNLQPGLQCLRSEEALLCQSCGLVAGVFNRLLKGHRCIVLLNGFYEWAKVSNIS